MPNDHAELVSLLSVMSAAQRGLSPLGPEFAGFVVLEAASRLREAGGGVATARELAIDVTGQVHLVAQPARGDDVRCTTALRALLGALLESATSSTPALRTCARRKEQTSSSMLTRELQAALIPLNRAASRRGVARVAKSTAEALANGSLPEPSFNEAEPTREPSPSPPPAVTTPKVVAAPPAVLQPKATAPMTHLPSVIIADETTPCDANGPWVEAVGATPVTLAEIERTIHDAQMAPVHEVRDVGPNYSIDDDAFGEEEPFEVVSNLPPLVAEVAPRRETRKTTAASTLPGIGDVPRRPRHGDEDDSPRAAFAVPLTSAPRENREDRVEALIAGFSVSRLRDDPALSRDLKAMVGIETSAPPAVRLRELRESASSMAVDVPLQPTDVSHEDFAEAPLDDDALPRRRGGRPGLALFALLVLGAGIAVGVLPRTRNAVRALFSPPSLPPGDVMTPTHAGQGATTPRPATTAAHLPTACEGTLTIDGVPSGAEVVRKLGVAPVSVSVPMHVPLDLIGVSPGLPPRRVHVDPSAAWLPDVTGPHLELPVMLDIGGATTWPARAGELSPAPMAAPAGRGSLRIVGNPPGTTVWLVVSAGAMAVPCGNPIDLLVIVPPTAPRSVHVEWSTFTGAPPHAITKL